jgi:mono/diheme cytochrome c family protein
MRKSMKAVALISMPLVLMIGALSNAKPAKNMPVTKPVSDPADLLDEHIPAGEGRGLVMKTCNMCHQIEKAVAEHRPVPIWAAFITDMRGRGAQANDAQAKVILAYLARHFGQVEINTASKAELIAVLGITPKEAGAILIRRAKTKYTVIDELKAIKNIDPENITF